MTQNTAALCASASSGPEEILTIPNERKTSAVKAPETTDASKKPVE